MAEEYDLAIVGGGINGAGIAQAAAAAGQRVLLLEQTALAHGTSSRSSKLVHGGLRYLETAQFALVRESLRERALLLHNAPELVRLVPFHIPLYRGTRRRPRTVRAGLALYALLGGLRAANRFSSVPRSEWDRLDGLDTRELETVLRYFDAQTDDAALTRAVARSAAALGAVIRVPARFETAELHADGCDLGYTTADGGRNCRVRVLVNAAGPWVDRVAACVQPPVPRQEIDLVRGTHIVLHGGLAQGIYYLEAPDDGRAVFLMPHAEGVLAGTTEAVYDGEPDAVTPPEAEQAYLRRVLARYFPALHEARLVRSFAGLRVLPRAAGRAFDRPRETILLADRESRPRYLCVYGGKLTTYRATAAKVMARIGASLPHGRPRGDTRKLALTPE